MDALPHLVAYLTLDERYGMVNEAYLAWFGVPPQDVVGKTILSFLGPEAHARIIPHIRQCFTGQAVRFEQYDVPYRLGGHRDVSFNFVPHFDADGTVLGASALLEDITARRRLEKEATDERARAETERDLAQAAAELEAEGRARTEFLLALATALGESLDLEVVLQRLVDGIAPARAGLATVWDTSAGELPKRRVHAPLNASLSDAKALPATDPLVLASARPVAWVVATGVTQFIPSYEAWMVAAGEPAVGRAMASIGVEAALLVPIRRGEEIVAVLALTRPAGSTFSPEDTALFESAARLAALAYENARLFGEAARLRQAAEDATVAKDAFLARVSHDLRNPLNSILGWSGLLRTMKDPGQIARGIDVIERNAKAQVQLIEDLLDVSRIAMGKLALNLSVEDVRSALDTALDPARLSAAAKKVNLEVVTDKDVGSITVDRDRFRQILWNLVANAVKFTPAGGTVRVTAQRLASSLQVVVADTGRGIATDFLPKVFAAFVQAEAGARRVGGLGLGLAIVKDLVELHGGTIAAASEGEGLGATFTVRLPIRAAVRPDTPLPLAPRALAGVRLVVVDDEEEAREIVTTILAQAGAVVFVAGSADEALAAVIREHPAAIVSDIGMPIKDGMDFLRDVRSLPESQGGRTPAIALTALVRAQDRVRILAAGFNAHVSKPVEPTELVFVVAGLLGLTVSETNT